jgi:hypothetical protein
VNPYVGLAPAGSARSGVNIPRIGITIALSIVLHALLIWVIRPHMLKPEQGAETHGERRGPLSVEIAPRFRPPAPPVQRPQPPTPPQPVAPRVTPRPKPEIRRPPPQPPVMARNAPTPEVPRPQVERAVPTPPSPPPRETDLASMLEARRRARGEATATPAPPPAPEPSPPVEDARTRSQRIAEANLGTNRKPKFGERGPGGGIFQIRYMAYDYAEFGFYGWNPDIRRDTGQVIQVRKENNPDIRVAVVRRMIAIIRSYKEEDFTWESPRLNRVVTKSARQRDTAELEAFLMQEFFEDDRRPIGR